MERSGIFLRHGFAVGGGDAEKRKHRRKLKLAEQLCQSGGIDAGGFALFHGIEPGNLTAYLRKGAREKRILPPRFQLGTYSGACTGFCRIVVEPVQRRGGGDKLQRRFLAYSRDSGDIVGGISHQGLHIDKLIRRYAVFFGKPRRIV